jgi:hypothetical protein
MTDATTPSVPAGWYPDPAGSAHLRWWNGVAWTDQFQQPYSTDATAAALRAPDGTKAYTPWIWLVVFLPYVTLPFLFTIDIGSMFDPETLFDETAATQAQLSLLTSPGYLLLTLLGWAAAAATVLFSWLDFKALRDAGVPKPFHWAFGFISLAGYPVYAIGRAVVTKRRTGHGSAVLWVTIIAFVVSIIVVLAWAVVLFTQIMQAVTELPFS